MCWSMAKCAATTSILASMCASRESSRCRPVASLDRRATISAENGACSKKSPLRTGSAASMTGPMCSRFPTDRSRPACPGPFTLSGRLQTGGIYQDRLDAAWALAPIVNAECRALQEAGATFIQVDEPSAAVYPERMTEYVTIFNAAVDGIDAKIGSHICFGNFRGRPVAQRDVPADLPGIVRYALRSVPAGVRQSGDGRNRALEGIPERPRAWLRCGRCQELLVRDAGSGRSIGFAPRCRYVAPDKLWIVPDCGFSQTARWATKRKLAAMVQGAEIVRRELAG